MKFTEAQIEVMDSNTLLDSLEMVFVEQNDQIKVMREFEPRLREILTANVEIVEEGDTGESVQGNIVRTDLGS
jgi:uncharacterized membrane protein (UPF0127 family)